MTGQDEQEVVQGRNGRLRIVLALIFALIALAIAIAWSQRRPIARHYIDRALTQRGVPASYRITGFGPSQQVLEDVRIGDPANLDLTARRAVVHLSIGLGGPVVEGIDAEGVRLRGRLEGGAVRFGAVDRLLPAPSGKPFALPDLDVRLRDAALRLDTPAGPIGLALNGDGNLADGFRGTLAAVTRRLTVAGCTSEGLTAYLNVAIADAKPTIDGPVRAAAIDCVGARATGLALAVDAAFSAALDRWKGQAMLELFRLRRGDVAIGGIGGRIGFDGTAAATKGLLALTAEQGVAVQGSSGAIGFDGRYRIAGDLRVAGGVRVANAALTDRAARAIVSGFAVGAGTPIAPLAEGLGRAVGQAVRRIDGNAELALRIGGAGNLLRIDRASVTSASGARMRLAGQGLLYGWPSGGLRLPSAINVEGGGLPAMRIALRQSRAGGPISGDARVAPYAVAGAGLALAPVRFESAAAGTRIVTRIELSGPLADGRVDRLVLPIDARLGAGGQFAVNPRCAPLDFTNLAVAGLRVGTTRLALCPVGGGLVVQDARGRLSGGGRIARPRLAGTIGGSPATIAAGALGFTVGRPGFAVDALAVRLGSGEAVNRLDVASIAGTLRSGGAGGKFAGLAGKLAAVPLLISDGAGDWTFLGAKLDLAGAIRVDDAAPDPRFRPLESDAARLSLAGGVITATAPLGERETDTKLIDLTLAHDLASGRGDAVLDTPGIAFTPALQPEQLTRLTLGVVANVRGTVSGRGTIAWGPDGVRSSGTYRTAGMDLAAAFGPVTGLSTELRFTDLLALVTAPDQVATIAEANPGIAVRDGVIRYRLLADQQVQVTSGRWPFSGGELVLQPTLLDFGRPVERRFTFAVVGMDAAEFVQQFDFKNVAVTGVFDGTLPIIFDANGGRIEGGRLVVRDAGGTLAYVGEVSNADLGMFGSLAFDALKRMRYRSLAIELDGALDGELVSRVLFDGTNETPKDASKRNGLLSQFSNLPFRFRITIRAPFRGLLNAAQSLNDPRGLIQQAIPTAEPALPGSAPVQPR